MAMRKILFLTKYGTAGASSRYRVYAYLEHLRRCGWETAVEPLLSDRYVESLYKTGKKRRGEVLEALASRALTLCRLRLRRFDVIFVQYELFPYLPFVIEAEFYRRFGDRIVADYDDASFALYQENTLLKEKIAGVMSGCRLVLTGNQYLAAYAKKYARAVAVLPTAVEIQRYRPKQDYGRGNPRLVVGWVGTPVTVKHLASAAPAFQAAAREVAFTLRCIGAPPGFAIPGVDVEVLPWSEESEAAAIGDFDVGVMPLVENAFTIGKCGLKLIQYMASGVPGLATRLGANCEIIQDGENGYLASSQSEFTEKLCTLLRDSRLREAFGRAGRETVERNYSLDVTAPSICALLDGVAHGPGACAQQGSLSMAEKSPCAFF